MKVAIYKKQLREHGLSLHTIRQEKSISEQAFYFELLSVYDADGNYLCIIAINYKSDFKIISVFIESPSSTIADDVKLILKLHKKG